MYEFAYLLQHAQFSLPTLVQQNLQIQQSE